MSDKVNLGITLPKESYALGMEFIELVKFLKGSKDVPAQLSKLKVLVDSLQKSPEALDQNKLEWAFGFGIVCIELIEVLKR